jgi:glutamate synthase (NADPH/NADH) small chain
VVQAMTFLTQQTKSLYGEEIPNQILATGKDVIIGGGDTGSDCVGTSTQGQKITNLRSCLNHLLDEANYTLALLAIAIKNILFTSGCDRNWLINTKEFISNEKGELVGLKP